MEFSTLWEGERYQEITDSARASCPGELDYEDLWYLARSYGYTGRVAIGRRLFREHLLLYPDETWQNLEMGKFESEFGAWGEAFRAFDRILARDPGHAEALYRSGLVLTRLGRRREAAERMIQAEPSLPAELRDDARLEIAMALWRPSEAAEQLARLEAQAPESLDAAQELALVYVRLRMTSQVERVLSLHPVEDLQMDGIAALMWLKWKRHRWLDVVELGERMRERSWLPLDARYRLCAALARLKRGEEALCIAQEVPEDVALQLQVKMFVQTETDPKAATLIAEELLALNPENVDALALATAGRLLRFDIRGARAAWRTLGRMRVRDGAPSRVQRWIWAKTKRPPTGGA